MEAITKIESSCVWQWDCVVCPSSI